MVVELCPFGWIPSVEAKMYTFNYTCRGESACLLRVLIVIGVYPDGFYFCHCRRLDPSERPLQMVYDYLAAIGYQDPLRVQREAANSDLSCMIRFYSGE